MRAHLFCLLAVACVSFVGANRAAGTEPVSYRQATALSAAERYDLNRKAERGDWRAAFALALYYAGAAPNIKNREYFLTLASKSGSRESIEALADFYSMPGGVFQIQKALSLRRDLKSKFPNEVDNIDWAEGCAFEYHYLTTEAARKKEVIFLKLAASLGSTKAQAALQKIGVDSTPTAGILAVNDKAAMKSVNDHLVPVKEVGAAQGPEAAYERLWRQKLLVTPGEIARSVHLPGTVGVETAVSVYHSPSPEGDYWVTATQTSESLWGCVVPDAAPPRNPNSIEVVELKARLPENTALTIQKVWRAMLLGVREPPKSTEMLLEGSTEIFSAAAADGKFLIGQFQGLGQRNTAALSMLANLLLQYCDSPETERVDIAHKIDKAASDLLSRVASSGSKKRNSKSALSQVALTPRKQHTSRPIAGRKPAPRVTRLGSSIDDFRSRWGPPVRGVVLARTTRLVWKPAGRKNKALPLGICEAQVSFLDRIACEIVLRSKEPLTKRKSVKLAKMVVPRFRASDLATHQSRSGGCKTYALSSGGYMITYWKPTVIVTRSPLFLQNNQLFAQEAPSVRRPTANR
jgi:hypothetical protein